MQTADLKEFTEEVAKSFGEAKIPGPVHLSGGTEDKLLELFQEIGREDWVFSTYRSHYHALLHGVPRDYLWKEILAGRSMNIFSTEHRFVTSAIVGGILPIAIGVADGIKRRGETNKVWCFIGDMAASIGAFHDAVTYARGHDLPVTFVIEDNGFSCNSPTKEIWGEGTRDNVRCYTYSREYPHVGIGRFVRF